MFKTYPLTQKFLTLEELLKMVNFTSPQLETIEIAEKLMAGVLRPF